MDQRIDYAEIGLMAGLEVHQQLLTTRKLFCRCPAGLFSKTHDASILRHMRPTLSELGVYDGTALMEFRTKKNIVYLLDRKNTCTYEMDDTPPFLIDEEAIDVAIEQCLMLGCDVVDEVHIARKQYLDGSIPTGFQRTAIVGVEGKLPFRGRTLGIIQVSVEEDSCREVSDRGHLAVWRTDRLGMPLIETVTAPDLRTPEEVEEAILLVGRVCRSTRHVRTGMGASRQDVNVSVRGGTRIEIKGVPKAGWAPALVHGEAIRQVNLLRLKDALSERGFRAGADVAWHEAMVTDLLVDSSWLTFRSEGFERFCERERRRSGIELGVGPFGVRAIRLNRMKGLLAHPTQPDRDFGDELRGRVRVIAGLDQAPILIHDDDWPSHRGADRELQAIRERLGCQPEDAVVLVWGPQDDTLTAREEITKRVVEATLGVPPETRQPFEDGHTDFERILPGPDRMYPDTDSPPTALTPEHIDRLRAHLAPPPWEREARHAAADIPVGLTHWLIRRGGADLVDAAAPPGTGTARLRRAAFFFGERLKAWRRAGQLLDRVPEERWVELFMAMEDDRTLRDFHIELARRLTAAPERSFEEAMAPLTRGAPPPGWQDTLRREVTEDQMLKNREPDARKRHHVGRALGVLRGRVPAVEIARLVEAILTDQASATTKEASA